MEIIKCWEENGELIKEPFKRHIKLFYGPDKRNIPELNFTQAIIYPGSGTDYHLHDRPELIYVVHGKGVAICEGEEYPIETDCVFWVPTGMMHPGFLRIPFSFEILQRYPSGPYPCARPSTLRLDLSVSSVLKDIWHWQV